MQYQTWHQKSDSIIRTVQPRKMVCYTQSSFCHITTWVEGYNNIYLQLKCGRILLTVMAIFQKSSAILSLD